MIDCLTFRIGKQWYGIEVHKVIEVLQLVALDELPMAPPDVLGLMTLRDQVIPVVDLRRRFGETNVSFTLQTPIIAFKTDKGMAGVVVDDVDTVIPVEEEADFEDQHAPYIKAIARMKDHLLMILDTASLMAPVESLNHTLAN